MNVNSTNAQLKSDIQVEMMKKSQDVQQQLIGSVIEQLNPKNDELEKAVANETQKGINFNVKA